MASERTSHPEVTDSAGKTNSLAPEASTVKARLSRTDGSRVGD
ncbi:hypothetical protein GCM10023086_59280 [Streptomyces venetus]|uniref:Uncharacterized protein n=1 Tax=Streptomyces venetus TaxID=1701086 RepID=A0ABP8GU59_9ACTN